MKIYGNYLDGDFSLDQGGLDLDDSPKRIKVIELENGELFLKSL